jgi:hypothetical protein
MMAEPWREPVAGVILHGTQFGCGAQRIGNASCRALVIRKGHADMAIVENRVVRPIGFLDLIERLRNEEGFQAVACHEGERRLEEVEPPERRKLVEHEEHAVASGFGIELFGQSPSNLVEHQAHERLGAADVGGRHNEIESRGPIVLHEICDPPVAA